MDLVGVQRLFGKFLHNPMLISVSLSLPANLVITSFVLLQAVLDFTFYAKNITKCRFTEAFPLKMSVFFTPILSDFTL